jgi:hypothetical protein
MAGKYIELRQQRDFGEVLNTSFEFVTSNFGNFFKVVFTIVGPIFVAAFASFSVFGYRLFNRLFNGSAFRFRYYDENPFSTLDFVLIGIICLAGFVGVIILYITIYGYLKEYNESRNPEVQTRQVWNFVKKNFFRYIGSGLVFFLFLIIAFALLFFMVSIQSPLLIFLGFLLLIAVYVYQSLFFSIITFEGFNPVNAIARGFNLVWGKWWFTFGVMFVLGLLSGVLNSALNYGGVFLVSLVKMNSYDELPTWLTRIGLVSYVVLAFVFYMFIGSLSIVKDAILYFSYTEEKESYGLLEKLHMISGDAESGQPEITVEKNKTSFSSEQTEEDF